MQNIIDKVLNPGGFNTIETFPDGKEIKLSHAKKFVMNQLLFKPGELNQIESFVIDVQYSKIYVNYKNPSQDLENYSIRFDNDMFSLDIETIFITRN